MTDTLERSMASVASLAALAASHAASCIECKEDATKRLQVKRVRQNLSLARHHLQRAEEALRPQGTVEHDEGPACS